MIEFPHLMQVVMATLSLGAIITTIVMTRGKAAADKVATLESRLADKASISWVDDLADRIDKTESRTTQIEGELRHLPSREQTHGMELALQEMKGQLAVLTEKTSNLATSSQRVQEYLMEDARGGRKIT